jgi:hypothetical protein
LFFAIYKGKKTALLNAYPQRYFTASIQEALYSSIPLAVTNAGYRSSGRML